MKAIITDLDRTLLHTDKSVSEHTIEVLRNAEGNITSVPLQRNRRKVK